MAREIPEVVRAAAGLAATVLDEARKLPETLPGLPVRILGLAMQQAMKVQQQYAGLVARGDELFTGLRGDDEPGLATFDDDEPVPAGNGFRDSAFDRAGDAPATSGGTDLITDEEVEELPADPPADAITAVVDQLAEQVEDGRQSIEELIEEAPEIEEVLDEIAIDELVDQAPTLEETAPVPAPAAKPRKSRKSAAAPSAVVDAPAAEAADATEDPTVIEAADAADDATVTGDGDALERALLESDDSPAAGTATAADTVDAEPTADVSTTVDVLTPDGGIDTVEATVTDEGVAAPESAEDASPEPPATEAPVTESDAASGADATATDTDTTPTSGTNAGPATATDEGGTPVAAATGVRTDVGGSDTSEEDAAIAEGAAIDAIGEASAAPTDDPEGGSELSGAQAAGTAPIEGYDGFSIAQLRGRLRGYALATVADLVAYEEATRAREPYLRMLRNRLEKLEEQAVESSPLAPRGA
jgi:hypothetical protein